MSDYMTNDAAHGSDDHYNRFYDEREAQAERATRNARALTGAGAMSDDERFDCVDDLPAILAACSPEVAEAFRAAHARLVAVATLRCEDRREGVSL